MCEVTNGKIYVADEDIICYKLVIKTGIPGAYKPGVNVSNLRYIEGVRYREDRFNIIGSDTLRECWTYSSEGGGMWYYRKDLSVGTIEYYRKHFTKWVIDDRETDCCMTNKGFYSYTYFMNGRMSSDIFWYRSCITYVVARCRIPKGARYCVSDDGEVFVSDEIVFEEVLDIDTKKTGYELCRFEY